MKLNNFNVNLVANSESNMKWIGKSDKLLDLIPPKPQLAQPVQGVLDKNHNFISKVI